MKLFVAVTKTIILSGLLPLATACMTEKRLAENADRQYFCQKSNSLTAVWTTPFGYDRIKSKHAPLGPFLGNGDVGVVSYTSANSQTLQLSKVDFVTDGKSDWAGDGPAALPAGGVSITVESDSTEGFNFAMDQMNAELHMTTGTIIPVEMSTWAGINNNVIITKLTTRSKTPVTINVETFAKDSSPIYSTTAEVHGDISQVTRRTQADDKVRWISQVGISTRILGSTGSCRQLSDSRVQTTFTLSAKTPVYILTLVSGGGTNDNARLPEALATLATYDNHLVKQHYADKSAWWKDMWTRSYVETNDSLLDRHYLSSIYLLASAHNSHSPVCGGMYGVWNMDDDMNYHGDIHLNYNSQAGFYSVFSANRPELAMPFLDFITKMIPEGKRRAREEMGLMHPSWEGKSCRGILFPVSALGTGCFYCKYWQQTMDAPFNVPLFSWYYEYTGDKIFLREKAYPFIRECGDFYEDYLDKEDFGDSYRYTITTGGHESSWDLNPPSDLGFVEQTFRLLLRYSEILDVDSDRRALWKDIISHLPEYKVIMPTKNPNQGLPVYAKNEAGWDWPSHVIQLHPVYPCEIINLHSDSTALQLARNTLYYYEVSQNGFTGTMNELGLSAFIMGARIGFSPEILTDKMRELISRASKNFLITDGHHCLEKTTVIETVNSMMLQSVDGVLHLFPCWLKKPASFTRLRTKGGFIVSANFDGNTTTSLRITSTIGGLCKLQNPWPIKAVSIKDGRRPITTNKDNNIVMFETQAGHTYTISPK